MENDGPVVGLDAPTAKSNVVKLANRDRGVDDFDASYERMVAVGIRFLSSPRIEPYGRVAVFLDLEGNRWALLGPRLQSAGGG